MNATRIHALLDEACRLLEADHEHAIAAFVGQGKAMVEARYPIGAARDAGDHE